MRNSSSPRPATVTAAAGVVSCAVTIRAGEAAGRGQHQSDGRHDRDVAGDSRPPDGTPTAAARFGEGRWSAGRLMQAAPRRAAPIGIGAGPGRLRWMGSTGLPSRASGSANPTLAVRRSGVQRRFASVTSRGAMSALDVHRVLAIVVAFSGVVAAVVALGWWRFGRPGRLAVDRAVLGAIVVVLVAIGSGVVLLVLGSRPPTGCTCCTRRSPSWCSRPCGFPPRSRVDAASLSAWGAWSSWRSWCAWPRPAEIRLVGTPPAGPRDQPGAAGGMFALKRNTFSGSQAALTAQPLEGRAVARLRLRSPSSSSPGKFR